MGECISSIHFHLSGTLGKMASSEPKGLKTLALGLVFVLAACGNSSSSPTDGAAARAGQGGVDGSTGGSSGSGEAGVWPECILNSDGMIDWTKYAEVAEKAGELAVRDCLLGPKYDFYHPEKESIPTLELSGDDDGFERHPDCPLTVPELLESTGDAWGEKEILQDWYAQAGPVVYVPDDPGNGGVMQVASGEVWILAEKYGYDVWAFWHKVHSQRENWYTHANPKHLDAWNSPGRATAVALANGIHTINMYVAFDKGLIGTFIQVAGKGRYPFVQLPAGKTPMALAVTPGGEFVLAAVWDSIQRKGQLAVIAVQGGVLASSPTKRWGGDGTFLYGFPNWGVMKELKLLGFIDLPIAAPTAIAAGHNLQWTESSRGSEPTNENIDTLLDTQSERDIWYQGGPAVFPIWNKPPPEYYKRTASAGYAVVASRGENKVVFVDLQPLLSYYREMYFTTQERYDETKNMGAEANQWPYTFDHRPEQRPVVAHTLDVEAPTAVAAGLSGGQAAEERGLMLGQWRSSSFDGRHAYVTTMDGRLLVYALGGLNTESAATQPDEVKAIPIGKNPTSIDFGNGAGYPMNDMVIACRGDNAVYCLTADGDIQYVLRDSRIVDAVMAERSYIARHRVGTRQIHVVDFAGKTVLTYSVAGSTGWLHGQEDAYYEPNHFFSEPMKFGARSDPIPGFPFAFQQDEVP
jgi:hypothetical protein